MFFPVISICSVINIFASNSSPNTQTFYNKMIKELKKIYIKHEFILPQVSRENQTVREDRGGIEEET